MREVPTHDCARRMPRAGDRADVQQLTAVVVHSAEQDHRNALPLAVEVIHDVLASQRVLALARPEPNDGVIRIVAMPAGLTANSIAIRWECAVLNEDSVSIRRRPVEARHE